MVRVRPAAPGDLAQVGAVEARCFGASAWSPAQLADALARTDGAFVVVERDGEILGHGVGWAAAGTSEVLIVAVHPDAQGQGLGRQVLDALHAAAWARGAEESLLEVRVSNAPARALYARAGYAQVGLRRRYYADGEDALVLRLARQPDPPKTMG